MALADVFGSEDRVPVKFSEFYDLMKGCAERELLTNAVKARVPHECIGNSVKTLDCLQGKISFIVCLFQCVAQAIPVHMSHQRKQMQILMQIIVVNVQCSDQRSICF